MSGFSPGPNPPDSERAGGALALLAPGCLVLLSSTMVALSSLFVQPENPAVFSGSLARAMMGSWLRELGLYDMALAPSFQALFFGGFLSLGTLGLFWALKRLPEDEGGPCARSSGSTAWIVVVAALALLPQVLAWPIGSTDILLYNLHARVASVYGENPFVVSARELPRVCVGAELGGGAEAERPCKSTDDCAHGARCGLDPYLELSPWAKHPASYGPAAVGFARLSYDPALGIYGNALVFRLWTALSFLFAGLLLGWAVGAREMLVLLWCPLGWFESGNGGHYEAVMVLGLVGLLILWKSREHPYAPEAMALLAGALLLFKLTMGLLLLPLLVAWRASQGWARAMRFAVGVSIIVALGYFSVWDPPHPLGGLLAESTKTVRSPLHLLRHLFWWLGEGDPISWLSPLALVVLFAWLVPRLMGSRCGQAPFLVMAQLWLFATCFTFGAFHPWHALVPLVLGLLSSDGRGVRRAVILLAQVAPLVGYGAFFLLRRFDMVAMVPSVLLIFGPVIWIGFQRDGARAR